MYRRVANIRRTLTFGNSQLEFSPTISLAKTSQYKTHPEFWLECRLLTKCEVDPHGPSCSVWPEILTHRYVIYQEALKVAAQLTTAGLFHSGARLTWMLHHSWLAHFLVAFLIWCSHMGWSSVLLAGMYNVITLYICRADPVFVSLQVCWVSRWRSCCRGTPLARSAPRTHCPTTSASWSPRKKRSLPSQSANRREANPQTWPRLCHSKQLPVESSQNKKKVQKDF